MGVPSIRAQPRVQELLLLTPYVLLAVAAVPVPVFRVVGRVVSDPRHILCLTPLGTVLARFCSLACRALLLLVFLWGGGMSVAYRFNFKEDFWVRPLESGKVRSTRIPEDVPRNPTEP